MNAVLETAISNAVFAAALAVVVFAVTRIIRRPALAAGLWLLVLAKLVTPAVWTIPAGDWVGAGNVVDSLRESNGTRAERVDDIAVPRGAEPQAAAHEPLRPAPDASRRLRATQRQGSDVQNSLLPAGNAMTKDKRDPAKLNSGHPVPLESQTIELPWSDGLLACWLAGTLGILVVPLARAVRFDRLVQRLPPGPDRLQEIADDLSPRFGLHRTPRVLVAEGRIPPLLWVFRRAAIVLPAELLATLPRDEQRMLVAHELAHYRRGDHLVRWFEAAVAALYWWHPAVWWARRELRRAEEACCDAWVLWAFPEGGRAYANLLLDTLDFLSGARTVRPALASGFGPARGVKRRLNMILKNETARRLSRPGRVGLLVAGAVVLGLSAGWSQEPTPENALPAPSVEVVVDSLPQPSESVNAGIEAAPAPAIGDVSPPASPAVDAVPSLVPTGPAASAVIEPAQNALDPFAPASELAAPATPLSPTPVPPGAAGDTPATAPAAAGRLDARQRKVIDALVAALDDKDSQVRATAAYALGRIGHKSDGIVTALTRVVRNATEPGEVRSAVRALGKLANPSRQSIETLVSALRHGNEDVRESARRSLREITENPAPEEAIDALVQALVHDEKYVREAVQESLREIGGHSDHVVEALATAIKSENRKQAEGAYETLSRLRAVSDAVVDALVALLQDENRAVRDAAIKSLGQTLSLLPSEKAIDALIQAAGNENATTRRAAIQALGGIEQAWPSAKGAPITSPYPGSTVFD